MVPFLGLGSALTKIVAVFLRHGVYRQPSGVPSAHLPHPLTPEGEAQAIAAATPILEFARREKLPIDPVIDASSLLRAWQTAGIVARELNAETNAGYGVETFDDLAERSLGAGANLTSAEIEAALAADPRYDAPPEGWKSDTHFKLPWIGTESLLEAGQRVAAHVRARLDAAVAAGEDGLKIFVGHGAAFRHAALDMGVLGAAEVAGLSMYNARPVFLMQGGDGAWGHAGGEWKVRTAKDLAMD